MNRPAPDELISAYFDGEVTPEERRQAENLLGSSSDLRDLLDETAKLSALLHSFPRESAPAGLAESIQAKVDSVAIPVAPAVSRTKSSLRREWIAFGAGMLVTSAALLVSIGFNPLPNSNFKNRLFSAKSEPEIRRSGEVHSAPAVAEFGESTVAKSDAAIEPLSRGVTSDRAASQKPAGVEGMGGGSGAQKDAEVRSQQAAVAVAEPPGADFLWNLKNGDLVVNPANTIAVGEYTVVDTMKGLEGIRLLLQKRDVPSFEEVTLGDLSVARKLDEQQPTEEALTRQNVQRDRHDDLSVVFAVATGEQLADTISESLKDHPDLFKKFEAQLLIGLPTNIAANTTEEASRDKAADAAKASDAGTPAAPSFSAEANLAVNSYLASNGLAASTQTSLGLKEVAKGEADAKKSPEGFAAFRVAVDNQRSQQAATAPNVGQANKSMLVAGSSITNLNYLQNSMANQGASSRLKSSRIATDQRDPRLIRMLIVLKPAATTR